MSEARRDLGTYHLRVNLKGGDGFIEQWTTGNRYTRGTEHTHPLDATHIGPTWEDEEALFNTMVWMYTEGNYACDCNKRLSLARAHQKPEPEDAPCGDTLALLQLTAIRPDMSEVVLWESEPGLALAIARATHKENK